METRFRRFFLATVWLSAGLFQAPIAAAEKGTQSNIPLIQPQVNRIEFNEAQINTDDFEILLAKGYLSIEDFGVNPITSIKLSYFINDAIFLQASTGRSQGRETSFEILSGSAPLLSNAERKLSYYHLNLGYNLLQGESFLSEHSTYNSAFFISAGLGSTKFAGDERFTINYGAGYRLLLNDNFAVYTDFRNHVFDIDVFGKARSSNNLEFSLGFSLFF